MSTQLSPQDWQRLSEFLDGQLARREHARLERRLNREAELRVALEELRQTRALLRRALPRRAPRNFTLTPEMISQRRRLPLLVPVFSISSALALILAMVLMVTHLLPAATPMMAAEGPAMELAKLTEVTPTPMIILWAPESSGKGGGDYGGEGVGVRSAEAPSVEIYVLPATPQGIEEAPPPSEKRQPEATQRAEAMLEPTQPQETLSVEDQQRIAMEMESAAPTPTVGLAPLAEGGPILGLPERKASERMEGEAHTMPSPTPELPFGPAWPALPAGLLVFAFFSAIASWWIWRRNRR